MMASLEVGDEDTSAAENSCHRTPSLNLTLHGCYPVILGFKKAIFGTPSSNTSKSAHEFLGLHTDGGHSALADD